MWIESGIQDCVGYVYALASRGEYVPLETVFFVNVSVNSDQYVTYAVTAAHIASQSRADAQLRVRMNRAGGGFAYLEIPHKSWFEHYSTDAAVAMLPDSTERIEATAIPVEWCVASEDWGEGKFGIGTDVFFVGLFDSFPGNDRNEPLVRFGRISLLPKERIRLEVRPNEFASVRAYLVEAHSWSGFSGSPAFVHNQQSGGMFLDLFGNRKLLGLVQGHYNTVQPVRLLGDGEPSGKADANAGIAIIVPAYDILDLLMRRDVKEDRALKTSSGGSKSGGVVSPPTIPGSGSLA